MQSLSLNGQWDLQKSGSGKKTPATVPGDVYADLLAAQEIPDPYYRDNELDLQWIGETDWTYSRTFKVSKKLMSKQNILLRCEGLDTLAKISINGRSLAETDNMFRTYEWDIRKFLKYGNNTIRVDFKSVIPYIRKRSKDFTGWKPMPFVAANPGWVRKEQCNFGWDWGIKVVTCGIWRSISMIAFDESRITDVAITQKHESKNVKLGVDCNASHAGALHVKVEVSFDGRVVADEEAAVQRRKALADLTIRDPKLWWPNNMGEQNLYIVRVELKNDKGEVIDQHEKRIGLRTITLDRHDDEWGESFRFVVNGVPFFAKGANWIPADAILARMTPKRYRKLVSDAAAANMNMLRVWGGGIYEDDSFYEVCDELGICVWQDFMFACSAYPTFDKDFMASVKQEARDAIKRLRHHPSMALWCGNNELEMMNVGDAGWEEGMMPWKAYKSLFDKLLPDQVKELSPDIEYWPSSPHSPVGDRKKHRSEHSGDAHLWIIGAKPPFECARGLGHRFASEFGFQSFPEAKTVAGFTKREDRNVTSRVMEHHQRAPQGNADIVRRILSCFRMPKDFDSTLWLSQILAGTACKGVCEHFRRNMPRSMGALYWQLNDCWPVASWASIDFHGRWKAMQYMARHFFAPVLISGVEDKEKCTVDIHLTSDRLEVLPTKVSWKVTDVEGKSLLSGSTQVKAPGNGNRKVKTLQIKKLVDGHGNDNILVWLYAKAKGAPVSRNLVLFALPKHLEMVADPGITKKISRKLDGSFSITLTSAKPALWVWLEGVEAEMSDNFVHLRSGITTKIVIRPVRKMTLQQIKKKLVARSLVDTYK